MKSRRAFALVSSMETDAIKKFILQIPFFKAFTDHELGKLVGREKLFKDSKKGGYIFKEKTLRVSSRSGLDSRGMSTHLPLREIQFFFGGGDLHPWHPPLSG